MTREMIGSWPAWAVDVSEFVGVDRPRKGEIVELDGKLRLVIEVRTRDGRTRVRSLLLRHVEINELLASARAAVRHPIRGRQRLEKAVQQLRP